jgi:hypothetical protein
MSFRRLEKSSVSEGSLRSFRRATKSKKEQAQDMTKPIPHEIVSEEARTLAHKSKQGSGWLISLDSWAVALALALTALVWAGWIKRIPW